MVPAARPRAPWRRGQQATRRAAASQRAAPAAARRAPGSRGRRYLAKVVDGLAQTVLQRDTRLPAELAPGAADVGSAATRIVGHRVEIGNGRAAGRDQLQDELRVVED